MAHFLQHEERKYGHCGVEGVENHDGLEEFEVTVTLSHMPFIELIMQVLKVVQKQPNHENDLYNTDQG